MIKGAVHTLYENPRDGDILMDTPATETWKELEEKAKDEKGWKLAVRSIKDGMYINNLGKGSK